MDLEVDPRETAQLLPQMHGDSVARGCAEQMRRWKQCMYSHVLTCFSVRALCSSRPQQRQRPQQQILV